MQLMVLFVLFLTGCSQCYTESGCNKKAREEFIKLSSPERERKREECKKTYQLYGYCWPSLYTEPTPEELERLKNEKK